MRVRSERKGGVKPSRVGIRPTRETSDSRMMASARNPIDRSLCLAQPAAVATPSSTNATALRFSRNGNACVIALSRHPELPDLRHLAHEQVDQLWVPLGACTELQDLNRFGDRTPPSI